MELALFNDLQVSKHDVNCLLSCNLPCNPFISHCFFFFKSTADIKTINHIIHINRKYVKKKKQCLLSDPVIYATTGNSTSFDAMRLTSGNTSLTWSAVETCHKAAAAVRNPVWKLSLDFCQGRRGHEASTCANREPSELRLFLAGGNAGNVLWKPANHIWSVSKWKCMIIVPWCSGGRQWVAEFLCGCVILEIRASTTYFCVAVYLPLCLEWLTW